ncbi:caspase-1-like isoform X2 [Daktulosphaira vitifoliae]|nr:caspase-1-like isoform X2 [Daktulosphaira vitifoliae]
MAEYIMTPSNESIRKKKFYEVIQCRGPNAFTILCKTLEETSNIEARNVLLSSKTNFASSTVLLSESMNDVSISNSDKVYRFIKNNDNYVKISPNRQRMDIEMDNSPNGVYHMGSKPKGHALIININKVSTKPNEERTGSDVDVNSLKKLFDGLGYKVKIKIDITQAKFRKVISGFSDVKNHQNTDSIIVVIMSHGEAGCDPFRSSDIVTADGHKINTDWIIEQFVSNKSSKNIPKLFFIQACRGENSDYGWSKPTPHKPSIENDTTSTGTSGTGSALSRRYENIFIAYSTVPGYYAKRDTVHGSWFIQKLCEVIRENAWQYDLDTMMGMVDTEIKKLNSIEYGFQTVEWKYRGFSKKFYFNPGLYDDDEVLESDL